MQKIKLFMMAAFLMLAADVSAQTYRWVETGKSFTDGTLLYTLGSYMQTASTPVTLGSKEVAVSLFLQPTTDQSIQVTDTIWTTYRNGSYGKPKTDGSRFSPNETGMSSTRIGTKTNEGVVIEDEDENGDRYFWERVINCAQNGININTASTVTIPTTVTFEGNDYDVVAIPFGGFCFPDLCTLFIRSQCDDFGDATEGDFWECMQGKNPFLTTVNIANDSKLRDIGDYAFVGCGNLQSIMIPKGVTKIGEGAFEFCQNMTTVTFQTNADGLSSSLETVAGYAFYGDGKITSLSFNENLVTIGDLALVYNFSLTSITLPNTLVNIGAHFVCDAKSLPTITIPANVTNINGAFLHGCNSLRTVYMLGYPTNLKASDNRGNTFGANAAFCQDPVHDCTFYVPESYLEDFQKHNVWRLIDDDGKTGTVYDHGSGYNSRHTGHRNWLKQVGTQRDFEAKKWTTAIFPKGVTNYKNVFGAGSLFAEYVSCERVADDEDPKSGKRIRMYQLHFRIIEGNDILPGVVGMFYPELQKTYTLWEKDDETDTFVADMSQPHPVSHNATNDADNALITMKGYYIPHTLAEWDFYLSANTNKFMRVRAGKEPTAGICRCFWTVNIDGQPAESSMGAKQGFFDDEPTDIGTMTIAVEEPDEIYDLSGRRISTDVESLKSGIYVVNGKKMVIK